MIAVAMLISPMQGSAVSKSCMISLLHARHSQRREYPPRNRHTLDILYMSLALLEKYRLTSDVKVTSMLNDLYTGSSRATVILSTLLVRSDADLQKCTVNVNNQIKSVAATQKASGRRLVLVDMQPPAGPTTAELVDGIHPTEAGYNKMATIWFKGIQAASDAGFLMTKEEIAGNPDGVPDRGVYG